MPTSEQVTFDSGGVALRGWLYRPEGAGATGPAVALSHGLSTTHCIHYWRVAELLAASGFVVLDFDPASFGASGGAPRQRWSPAGIRRDLEAAVAHLRTLPDVDPTKVALYGSSTGGGTAIDVASRDASIAALVAVVPHVDGLTNMPYLTVRRRASFCASVAHDVYARWRHRPQVTMQVLGPDGSGAGLLDTDGAVAAFDEEAERGGSWSDDRMVYTASDTVWRNEAAPLELARWLVYRPGRRLPELSCPVLLVSGDNDRVTPPGPQRRMAAKSDRVEVLTGPWNHFDVFRPARGFDEVGAAMVSFLGSALSP